MADFFDPRTLALLGAGAGFLDPNGGMMGGFQGAMQGYQSGLMAQDRKMQQQMIAHKLQRQMDVENTLRSLSQDGNNSDPIALGGALVRSGIPELIKQGTELLKTKQAKSFLKGVDQNGNPTFYTGYSTGEVSPTGVTPAEKLAFQNLGNQTIGVDPYTGKPKTSYAQGITPGQSASLGQSAYQFGLSHDLAKQNFALNKDKAALEQYKAFMPKYEGGLFVSPPKPGETAPQISETPYFSPPKGSQAEKIKLISKVNDVLGTDTRDLIKNATGSGLGTLRDAALGTVGVALDSAKAAQTLKMRAATLSGSMPRFEGPQSDADRKYYQEMAGNIGDSTLPASVRLSAVDELERMFKSVKPDGTVNTEDLRKSGLRGGSSAQQGSDGWGQLR